MPKGSSTPATTTQTQNTTQDPWAPLVPYLTDIFARGQTALNNTPNTAATTYAGPTADQTRAIQMYRDAATGSAAGAGDLRTYGQALASGQFLNPESNPYLRANINAAIDPVTQQLQRQILPGIADQAIMQGAYGGAGNGVQNGVAAGDWARAAGNISSSMLADNYQFERQQQNNAGNILNQANELSLTPARILDQAGSQQQAFNQAALDANVRAPWNGLGQFAQLLGLGQGYGTSSGTSTGTQTPARASGFGSFLQGAAGGAGAGSAFGPWGAGIGGLLGGLGGLFG